MARASVNAFIEFSTLFRFSLYILSTYYLQVLNCTYLASLNLHDDVCITVSILHVRKLRLREAKEHPIVTQPTSIRVGNYSETFLSSESGCFYTRLCRPARTPSGSVVKWNLRESRE